MDSRSAGSGGISAAHDIPTQTAASDVTPSGITEAADDAVVAAVLALPAMTADEVAGMCSDFAVARAQWARDRGGPAQSR